MDIGSCPKFHDVALRADYQKDLKTGKEYFYDLDVGFRFLGIIACGY